MHENCANSFDKRVCNEAPEIFTALKVIFFFTGWTVISEIPQSSQVDQVDKIK